MKFFIYRHKNPLIPYIGDQRALDVLTSGLVALGHQVFDESAPEHALDADHTILSNINCNLNPLATLLHLQQRPYSLIPFHEDYTHYSPLCSAFFAYVQNGMQVYSDDKFLQLLEQNPKIIEAIPFESRTHAKTNNDVMRRAHVNIANSPTEAANITKDCPEANTKVVFWGPGMLDQPSYTPTEAFLKLSGYASKEYILNIGRFEPRKNQLALILATRHLEIPLIFVANSVFKDCNNYAKCCIEAICKYRKAKTLILSSDLDPCQKGALQILSLKENGGLTQEQLISAYHHAAIYAHPAFFEQPGYTCLEAAKLGTPTLSTAWSTLKDYFIDQNGQYTLDDRIQYLPPHHIKEWEKAIKQTLTTTYSPSTHRSFHRTSKEIATDFLTALGL
ncbi:MAG: hypothetical protein S4CHLAM102_00150 [Chlamydiia bacterium]|nr:hypothetical protein [Chlamydiia bacterium]